MCIRDRVSTQSTGEEGMTPQWLLLFAALMAVGAQEPHLAQMAEQAEAAQQNARAGVVRRGQEKVSQVEDEAHRATAAEGSLEQEKIQAAEMKMRTAEIRARAELNRRKAALVQEQLKALRDLAARRDQKLGELKEAAAGKLQSIREQLAGSLEEEHSKTTALKAVAGKALRQATETASADAGAMEKRSSERLKLAVKQLALQKQSEQSRIATSGAAAAGLAIQPIALLQQLEDTSHVITSAELVQDHQQEREADEARAMEMIKDSGQNTAKLLGAKKVEQVKLAERGAINQARMKATVATTTAKQNGLGREKKAGRAYTKVRDRAQTELVAESDRIHREAGTLKMSVLDRKAEAYRSANLEWQDQKTAASEAQVLAFARIEAKQKSELDRRGAEATREETEYSASVQERKDAMAAEAKRLEAEQELERKRAEQERRELGGKPVSYTHLRAHETPEHLVCRLLLEKKKKKNQKQPE
eukprot:TRINITY_DN2380_c0_g1_i1.p1 TRINITY_DN2380_c0_g1~~TRINITY_DN2380_c0_g1_i1.p1  ORF type:complete len:476 (-),score=185.24 TRINITY_DN2380_c0_g1_i1:95-1522(-)